MTPVYCELCHEQLTDTGSLCPVCQELQHIDEVLKPRVMSEEESAAFRRALEGPVSENMGTPVKLRPLGDMSFEELSGEPVVSLNEVPK